MQRHHLLPRELLSRHCFGEMFDQIGCERIGFDDFRRNGLLLPAENAAALRFGLPLHRGPHRRYNAMVIDRIGRIEAQWSSARRQTPESALDDVIWRLTLLQNALRRRLLAPSGRRLALSRHDPLDRPVDYSELDAMADALWGECESLEPQSANGADLSASARRAA